MPTLSRLVAPLEDLPRSYLCDCLGIEYTVTSSEYHEDSLEYVSSFKPRAEREDYDVLYARADPILIHCNACKQEFSFKGVLPNTGTGVGFICACGMKYPVWHIRNTLLKYVRNAFSQYFTCNYVCDDGLCGFETNKLVGELSRNNVQNLRDDRCGVITCQGHMQKVFGASHCYLDMCYALATVSGGDDLQYKDVEEDLKKMISRLDYSFVNMNLFK